MRFVESHTDQIIIPHREAEGNTTNVALGTTVIAKHKLRLKAEGESQLIDFQQHEVNMMDPINIP